MRAGKPTDSIRLRRQLLDRLKNESKKLQIPLENVQYEFAFAIFLYRLSAADDCPWVLKGGTSLLLRIGSGRRTQDLDLARKEKLNREEAIVELQRAVENAGPTMRFISFQLEDRKPKSLDPDDPMRGNCIVHVFLGGTKLIQFKVDLSTHQHIDVPTTMTELQPIAHLGGVPEGAMVSVVPLESLVADKLCACYERHGKRASTRYHDLIDLVRVVVDQEFDARLLRQLIDREVAHRGIDLPVKVASPDREWEAGFPRAARKAVGFPSEYHVLENALKCVGNCINPLLANQIVEGRWDPESQSWRS